MRGRRLRRGRSSRPSASGQTEVAVADLVDLFVLLASPAGGDELQGIKRGIMELADLVVVTKADGELAAAARHACSDIRNALHLLRPHHAELPPEALLVSSTEGEGVAEVWSTISSGFATLRSTGALDRMRAAQARRWLWSEVTDTLVHRLRADPAVAALDLRPRAAGRRPGDHPGPGRRAAPPGLPIRRAGRGAPISRVWCTGAADVRLGRAVLGTEQASSRRRAAGGLVGSLAVVGAWALVAATAWAPPAATAEPRPFTQFGIGPARRVLRTTSDRGPAGAAYAAVDGRGRLVDLAWTCSGTTSNGYPWPVRLGPARPHRDGASAASCRCSPLVHRTPTVGPADRATGHQPIHRSPATALRATARS